MNFNNDNQFSTTSQGSLTYPSYPAYPTIYPTTTLLTQTFSCGANNHVFACDHALTCKCGKATRPAAVPCVHCKA